MGNTGVWLALAVAIVLVLAVVAAYMQYLVYRQSKRNNRAQQEQTAAAQQQRKRVNESIQILARSVEGEDLSLTEASIRIAVLLDSLGVDDSVREEFSSFYQLWEATGHIPILDNWKQLSPKEKHKFDIERAEQEAHFREFVLDAAQRIQGREF